mgnify:CR=1 FL=1
MDLIKTILEKLKISQDIEYDSSKDSSTKTFTISQVIDPDSVKSVLARVDLNGEIKYSELDSNANKKGDIKV